MVLSLKSSNFVLSADGKKGQILSIENNKIGTQYGVKAAPFYVVINGKKYFENASADSFEQKENALSFTYKENGFEAVLTYSAVDNLPFVEAWLSVKNNTDETVTFDKVIVNNLVFSSPAEEIVFHDDQTLWHVPTCYFARMKNGGVVLGLEYPYWENVAEGGGVIEESNENVILGYSPKFDVKAGEAFLSEKIFIGVYEFTGKLRHSEGPYPTKKEYKYYPDILRTGGINQHFPGNVIPEDAGVPELVLDWGEVYAMQDFLRYYLPEQRLPEDGYWFWQNGWWACIFNADIKALEPLERAGIRDLMTAAIYFGHDNHPTTEPKYIRDMRTKPLGFPRVKDNEGVHAGGTEGWHSFAEKAEGVEKSDEYTEEFHAPEAYETLVSEAEKKGIYISSFSTPNNAYLERPEWLALDENGKAHEYFGTRLSCPACDEYMDFHFDMLSKVIDRYKKRFWAFDGRWMCYSEIAGYHFGSVGPLPCCNPNHGHPIGDGRYKEWKNIEKFKRKLREKYPTMCLEEYYGLKRGGIWSMSSLNSDENYYEMASPENNRLQTWHNENDRFRPVYINYSSVFGSTVSEFEYSLISSMSTSSYVQVSIGYNALRDYPECADILKKHKKWADENYRYFKKRRCIFGIPGENAADGSAHILDGEGIIYIFTAPNVTVDARITFDEMLGFTKDESKSYKITTVTTVKRDGEDSYCETVCDTISFGDTLRARISPNTAAILKVEKSDSVTAIENKVGFSVNDTVVCAF